MRVVGFIGTLESEKKILLSFYSVKLNSEVWVQKKGTQCTCWKKIFTLSQPHARRIIKIKTLRKNHLVRNTLWKVLNIFCLLEIDLSNQLDISKGLSYQTNSVHFNNTIFLCSWNLLCGFTSLSYKLDWFINCPSRVYTLNSSGS